jgi:mannosyltransferase OCH1-like enzyme
MLLQRGGASPRKACRQQPGQAMSPAYIVRYLAARASKIFGNVVKFLYWGIHPLMPNRRFALPHQAAPLWARPSRHRIPKIIWQTNYTDRVTFPVYLNYLFNRIMSPTYEYRFMDDAECADFIARNYPADVVQSYSKLQIGAAKADFWRILVLRKYGGVYLDIDAHVVWPIGYMIDPDATEFYVIDRHGCLTNYMIASAPGNPHFDAFARSIQDKIAKNEAKSVFDLTGPRVIDELKGELGLSGVSFRYTCYQGSFTNRRNQYVDSPAGPWAEAQQKVSIVKD